MTSDVYADRSINDPTDAHYNDPWCRFMREMRDAFAGIPEVPRDDALFPGKNFMADEIVSYHRASGGEMIEVSYGRGFANDYVIGLSFRTPGAPDSGYVETFTDDPAGAAARLREVMDA
jgi:hypothetical protein